MNRALPVMLVLLALVVTAFVVTWVTLPGSEPGHTWAFSKNIPAPAHWFVSGLEKRGEAGVKHVELRDLKERIAVVFGAAALVVVLLGLAFGAGRRRAR